VRAEPTADELREFTEAIGAIEYAETFERFRSFKPHPKQKLHLDLGLTKRERLLMANNRGGKTETGAFEAACHLTGDYPDDWNGKRFDQPTMGWICGETSLLVRDVQQKKLCGSPGVEDLFGTGMIPKDAFTDKPSLARGVTDAYDTIQVRHKSGGISIGRFKSYEQGRQKFQGEGLDWIWFDEEPPLDIYAEGVARIGERDGISWLTFTPLKGRSAVVIRFLDDPSLDRGITTMTLDDAIHIPPAVRKKMEEGYLPHEREARAKGVPMLGSGRIFMTPEAGITEPPIEYIPTHWTKLWGIDFGIGHPFAAALILWDRDADVIHVHHVYRIADALPIQHAAAMKLIGANVPVAWPKDGADREKGSGEPLASLYKKQDLIMLPDHATWPDGGVSTEAGILEMDDRMKSGRFKVAAQLSEFFEEYRFYHRKDGQIVKLKDDIMSAARVAVMMKRSGKAVHLGSRRDRGGGHDGQYAVGTPSHSAGDIDAFTGA
jgi:phage terminase large subunit-like protein